jgi:hypothetical protein
MSIQAVAAIISFVALFTAWVVIPSRLRRHHDNKVEADQSEE